MGITIRPVCLQDAPAYLELACRLDGETKFMMLEPGERSASVEEQRKRIQAVLKTDNQRIFVAENETGQLVGLLGAHGGPYHRNYNTVHIYIGILQAYTGQGLGARLFQVAEQWARSWGAHRLELTVMCHNERGLALYHKMGFTVEGRQREALKVDGHYFDEFMMGKILE